MPPLLLRLRCPHFRYWINKTIGVSDQRRAQRAMVFSDKAGQGEPGHLELHRLFVTYHIPPFLPGGENEKGKHLDLFTFCWFIEWQYGGGIKCGDIFDGWFVIVVLPLFQLKSQKHNLRRIYFVYITLEMQQRSRLSVCTLKYRLYECMTQPVERSRQNAAARGDTGLGGCKNIIYPLQAIRAYYLSNSPLLSWLKRKNVF